jgi:glycosyltransferase involved in cell wall biosynthesis
VIIPGENGLLVPVGDTTALADALIRLLRNRPLRKKMGERNRKIIQESYTPEAVARLIMDLYTSLLEG